MESVCRDRPFGDYQRWPTIQDTVVFRKQECESPESRWSPPPKDTRALEESQVRYRPLGEENDKGGSALMKESSD
ncbi:hypothetical protein EVAR_29400_1 [Eumeta japonica]|uniref:Uncharacterized protein n=1 Tax=Eumeta variegata TaxID=151549 RepID=A0A4C1VW17_EUMVA|nr:hypothetical protein EVAR_29400_1 [Eumeta japonica]